MADQFHSISKNEIANLERQTNLTLYPYVLGGELARVRQRFSALNTNKYYLLLNMLVYGFDNKVLESSISDLGEQGQVIDKGFVNDFLKMAKDPLLKEIIKKTPAYQKGCFDDYGKYGSTQANTWNMTDNPITGPFLNEPMLINGWINRLRGQISANIEGFANKIRTSAYLSLPKRAFASIVMLARAINGVIAAFNKIIQDIYNGLMHYVRQVFAIINGLIAKIQQLIMMFLESIIPIDLLCILLTILQQMVGDIPFFTSLTNMSSIVSNFESTFNNWIYKSTGFNVNNFVANPFAAVSQFFPPEVNQIISAIQQFGNNPEAYLSSMLFNYGYGLAARSTQDKVYAELLNHYSPIFLAMNPIGSVLGDLNPNGGTYTPPTPVGINPDTTNNGKNDNYGKPLDSSKIKSNEAK